MYEKRMLRRIAERKKQGREKNREVRSTIIYILQQIFL
jgi:hypothetical protein